MTKNIPKEVKEIANKINEAGFDAYIVGGCVRDLLMNKIPKDWDLTTNAKPDEIIKLFPDSFYENEFGTVGVKTESEDEKLKVIEVTTYRAETGYSDNRRPDEVKFVTTLEEDLKRRDFTMNAIAMDVKSNIIDPFGGQEDIKNKIIRAVGDPEERFSEDALRMIRAVRFSGVLGFFIETETLEEIKAHNANLKNISSERIRDEFSKLIMGDYADKALDILKDTHLLEYIVPELLEGIGVGQNLHHIYTVWEHNFLSFKYSVEQKYSFEVRLASLLHDIGKPQTKRGDGYNSTFYGHDIVGERITRNILKRLKFSQEHIEKISKLVRWHMFYYDTEGVTESAVRRLIANIGKENVEDLLKVREADRIGSGVPKAIPYKLRHLKFMIDKVSRDPISPKMLKIKGDDIMKLLGIPAGPKIGMIVNALMEEVLDDPKKNTKKYLENRIGELNEMEESELIKLKKKGKEKMKELENEETEKIKAKHHVK